MKNEGEAFGFSHSNGKAGAGCSTLQRLTKFADFEDFCRRPLLLCGSAVAHVGCAHMDAKSLTDLLSALDGDSAVHLILEVLKLRPALSPAVVGFACPALTYAPARGMMERRCRGVVRQVDRTQGFGYIASPEIEATFGMDVLVRDGQLRAFQAGDEVSFTCVLNEEQKPQAFEVLPANGMPPAAAAPVAEWTDWNHWADGNDPKKRRL